METKLIARFSFIPDNYRLRKHVKSAFLKHRLYLFPHQLLFFIKKELFQLYKVSVGTVIDNLFCSTLVFCLTFV